MWTTARPAGGPAMDDLPVAQPRVWAVGALCRAVADALAARFNPVAVVGEISGFSRAGSGHCYFSLKDAAGQLRCAMFRRAAGLLDFVPAEGDRVEVRGRLAVYEPRGDLQLVVESLRRAGQGALFEEFLRRRARLEAEGLFDAARKRPIPPVPRRIGLVTSLGAAALHDVATALGRRVPHIPVVLAPAAVQGAGAPAELIDGLRRLAALTPPVDVILLVRGGGSIEDLWAFNDEGLARAVADSPVPVIVGVGHETDVTLADFCADLRAPTPTAAAEMVSVPRAQWLAALDERQERLRRALAARVDVQAQRLDLAAARLGRPSGAAARQRLLLGHLGQRMHHGVLARMERLGQAPQALERGLVRAFERDLDRRREALARAGRHLQLLDPALVLERGYAWLTDDAGHALTRTGQLTAGQQVRAQLADGRAELRVEAVQGTRPAGAAGTIAPASDAGSSNPS